ncbi:hypothetical protein [Tardiphaga sp. 11_C7_N12_6]|uniref:hypothetical protein n=1 Tax=Tardiphaga sp. 11_C7_N12_6 TaxID=3240789 RepID=UPI003F203211
MKSILLGCPACKQRISSSAQTCPQCGEPLTDEWEAKGRKRLKLRQIASVVFAGPLLLFCAAVVYAINTSPPRQSAEQAPRLVDRREPNNIREALPVGKLVDSSKTAPTENMTSEIQSNANSVFYVSRGAIACQSITNTQIIFQAAQADPQKAPPRLDGCWALPKGKALMMLGNAGQYALIAPIDELNEKGWTSSYWIEPK